MLRSVLIVLSLVATPAAALAPQPQPQAAQPAPAQDKVVCKSDRDTGSIMPRRTCHTQAEWQAIEAASAVSRQRALDDQDNQAAMRDR